MTSSEHDEALALLARGGWALDDVRARARENPDTFRMPPADLLAQVRPGHTVRFIMRLADLADPSLHGRGPYDAAGAPSLAIGFERLWGWVTARDGDDLTVALMNPPLASHTLLEPGSSFRCTVADVIDVDLEPQGRVEEELEALSLMGFALRTPEESAGAVDPARERFVTSAQREVCAAAGVRPQMPPPIELVRLIASPSVFDGDAWPVYGMRGPAVPDRGDCGWAMWTGPPDMGTANAAEPMRVIDLTMLHGSRVWPYVALPPGWCFALSADAPPDVWFDPSIPI